MTTELKKVKLIKSIHVFIDKVRGPNTYCALSKLYTHQSYKTKRHLPCYAPNGDTLVKCSNCVFSEIDNNKHVALNFINDNPLK